MRVTILGCGTSGGVPRPGGKDGLGEWGAANPQDARNRRRRCSILVRDRGKTLLVDTSPDLRSQLLDAHVERIDAVIWTHDHADQSMGSTTCGLTHCARGGSSRGPTSAPTAS